MLWLFVHVEQLLCVIVLVAVLLFWILKAEGKHTLRRWMPLVITALCIGLLVATEFAIDGKLFDISPAVCYAFMSVMLVVMGLCGAAAMRRWNAGSR